MCSAEVDADMKCEQACGLRRVRGRQGAGGDGLGGCAWRGAAGARHVA